MTTLAVKVRTTEAVRIYDDLIPDGLLEPVRAEISQVGFRYGWRSNKGFEYGHWNVDVVFGGMENTEDREAELIASESWTAVFGLWQFLKIALGYESARLLRCYINAMTYGTDGYPHVDSSREGEETAMVYLDPVWRREWAGETCIWDATGEEIEVAVTPKPGRLVCFDGRRWHRASGVSRVCPVARMTLMFKVGHAA